MSVKLEANDKPQGEISVTESPPAPKAKIIDFKVERLKRTNPEIFDPSLYWNNQPWSLEDYRERKALVAQADAVLALAVGFDLPFERRVSFAARMHDITLIDRKLPRRLRTIK